MTVNELIKDLQKLPSDVRKLETAILVDLPMGAKFKQIKGIAIGDVPVVGSLRKKFVFFQ